MVESFSRTTIYYAAHYCDEANRKRLEQYLREECKPVCGER